MYDPYTVRAAKSVVGQELCFKQQYLLSISYKISYGYIKSRVFYRNNETILNRKLCEASFINCNNCRLTTHYLFYKYCKIFRSMN